MTTSREPSVPLLLERGHPENRPAIAVRAAMGAWWRRQIRRSPQPRTAVYVSALLLAGVGLGGCPVGETARGPSPEQSSGPVVLAPAAVPPSTAPVEAAQQIFAAYVRDPAAFDRRPFLSRFALESARKRSARCGDDAACAAATFACLDPEPAGPGRIAGASAAGELHGVSASVRLHLVFGDRTATPTVDLVAEDGSWRIDQVRCPEALDP